MKKSKYTPRLLCGTALLAALFAGNLKADAVEPGASQGESNPSQIQVQNQDQNLKQTPNSDTNNTNTDTTKESDRIAAQTPSKTTYTPDTDTYPELTDQDDPKFKQVVTPELETELNAQVEAGELDGSRFSLAILPDTQFYSRYATQEGGDQFNAAYGSEPYKSQTQWIADNADEYNIQMTLHVGDIVDQANKPEQWQVASEAMQVLEDANQPYLVVAGNHDIGGDRNADGSRDVYGYYTDTFTKERAEKNSTFQGRGPSDAHEYHKFNVDGQDFLVLGVSWGANGPEMDWAEAVLKENLDIPTILVSHQLINIDPETTYAQKTQFGEKVWDRLIDPYDQVFLTYNGHHHGATLVERENQKGNPVYQILTDHQMAYMGGNGYMALTEFDLTNNKIHQTTFSPWVMEKPANKLNSFDQPILTDDGASFTIDFNFKERYPNLKVGEASDPSYSTQLRTNIQDNFTAPAIEENHLPQSEDDYPVVEGTVAHWKMKGQDGEVVPVGGVIEDTTNPMNNFYREELNVGQIQGAKEEDVTWSSDHHPLSASKGSVRFKNGSRPHKDSPGHTASYFRTKSDAPINLEEFENGYTFETFIKIDENFNPNGVNNWMSWLVREGRRGDIPGYTGTEGDEPPFSWAFSNLSEIQFAYTDSTEAKNEGSAWSGEIVDFNDWYHIAAVNDPETKTVTMYVNGVPVLRNQVNSVGIARDGNKPWRLGGSYYDNQNEHGFIGWIGETRLVDRPLDSSQWLTARVEPVADTQVQAGDHYDFGVIGRRIERDTEYNGEVMVTNPSSADADVMLAVCHIGDPNWRIWEATATVPAGENITVDFNAVTNDASNDTHLIFYNNSNEALKIAPASAKINAAPTEQVTQLKIGNSVTDAQGTSQIIDVTLGKAEDVVVPVNLTNTPDRITVQLPEDPSTGMNFNWYAVDNLENAKLYVSTNPDMSDAVEYTPTVTQVESEYYGHDKNGNLVFQVDNKPGWSNPEDYYGYFTADLINRDNSAWLGGYHGNSEVYVHPKQSEHIYKAEATGLQANTKYYYQVGDITTEKALSPIYSFTTASDSGDEFKFFHYTDTQNAWWNENVRNEASFGADTAKTAAELVPDAAFALHTGDIVEVTSSEDEWTDILNQLDGVARNVPHAYVAGNHEAGYRDFNNHVNVPLPNGEEGINRGSYYSFDYNGMHMAVLNTNDSVKNPNNPEGKAISDDQLAWLDQDLTQAKENGANWIVLSFHKPLYSSSYHSLQDGDVQKSRQELMEVIDRHDVDLVLNGHDHVLTVTKPLSYDATKFADGVIAGEYEITKDEHGRDVINSDGTIFIIPNTAGTKLYDDIYNESLDHIAKVRKGVAARLAEVSTSELNLDDSSQRQTAESNLAYYNSLFDIDDQPNQSDYFQNSHSNRREGDTQNFAVYTVRPDEILVEIYQVKGEYAQSPDRTTTKIREFIISKKSPAKSDSQTTEAKPVGQTEKQEVKPAGQTTKQETKSVTQSQKPSDQTTKESTSPSLTQTVQAQEPVTDVYQLVDGASNTSKEDELVTVKFLDEKPSQITSVKVTKLKDNQEAREFDIEFTDADGNVVKTTGRVRVTLPTGGKPVEYVYHLVDGVVEKIEEVDYQPDHVSFVADEFSVYGLKFALQGTDAVAPATKEQKTASQAAKPASSSQEESNKQKQKDETLPETGEDGNYLLFGAAATSVLIGLGLVAPKRREEN